MPEVQAKAAVAFTQSVGVNTHIDLVGSTYQNYAQMVNALAYLGVGNVRDTIDCLNDPAEYAQMASVLGVKFDFFLALGTAGIPWQLAQIEANPAIVNYVEGWNESDEWWQSYAGQTGLAATIAQQQVLYETIRANPAFAGIPVIQSSFGKHATFPAYGDQSAYADLGNSHSYYGTGNNPSAGNQLSAQLQLAQGATPGKPVITTETGYSTLANSPTGVSPLVQAKYILDLLFEQQNAGAVKTYLWNLADSFADPDNTDIENHYGLFDSDWTAKPVAFAIHNLMALMADPGAGAGGGASGGGNTGAAAPGALDYAISGMPATAQSALYRKSDGTFVLALWNDTRLSGPATQTNIAVAPVAVTVTLDQAWKSIAVYDPLLGTTAIESVAGASRIQLDIPDHPVLVMLSQTAAAPAVDPFSISAPQAVITTPGVAAQVQGLQVDPGAQNGGGTLTVTLTDNAGTLSAEGANGQALAGSGTGRLVLTGTVATVNTQLATVRHTAPTGAATGAATGAIAIQATQGTASARATVATEMVAPATGVVSGGPNLSTPSLFSLKANDTQAIPRLVLSDPWAATAPGTMRLQVSDGTGILRIGGGGAGSGGKTIDLSGSYAQVTAALASLTYRAGAAAGSDTLTLQVTDQSGHSSTGSIAITVSAAQAAATSPTTTTAAATTTATTTATKTAATIAAAQTATHQTAASQQAAPQPVAVSVQATGDGEQVAIAADHDRMQVMASATAVTLVDATGHVTTVPVGAGQGTVLRFLDGTGLADPTGSAGDVARLYLAALGRAPDLDGLRYFAAQVDAGTASLAGVAAALLSGTEAGPLAARDNAGFVQQVYAQAFGAPPSPAGLAYWATQLADGLPRASALAQIAESGQAQAATAPRFGSPVVAEVSQLYQATLGRAPEQAGEAYWADRIQQGGTVRDLADAVMTTPEYQAGLGGLSDADFVAAVYRNALGRAPDAAGFQNWTNILANGTGRDVVLASFIQAPEVQSHAALMAHANWTWLG